MNRPLGSRPFHPRFAVLRAKALVVLCGAAFCGAMFCGAAVSQELPNDPGSVRSPSDLLQPLAEVVIEVRDGQTFQGRLSEPEEFVLSVPGGVLSLPPGAMRSIELHDAAGTALLTLRNGNQLDGVLESRRVVLKLGYGQLNFDRARLRRITAVGADEQVAEQRTRVRRPPLPPVRPVSRQGRIAQTPGSIRHAAPAPAPAAPRPVVSIQPPIVSSWAPPITTRPDIFCDYPGVPTWHARPRGGNPFTIWPR